MDVRQQDATGLEHREELPHAVLWQRRQELVLPLGHLQLQHRRVVDRVAIPSKAELEGRLLTLERELGALPWLRQARSVELVRIHRSLSLYSVQYGG